MADLLTYLHLHATQRNLSGPVASLWAILPDGLHVSVQHNGHVAFHAEGDDYRIRVEVPADDWRDGMRRCRHGMQGVRR